MKNIKKICLTALISLLSVCAILLIWFNGNAQTVKVSDATGSDVVNINISADKTDIIPGDSIYLTIEILPSSNTTEWDSISIIFGPKTGDNKTMDTAVSQYLSLEDWDNNFTGWTDNTTDYFDPDSSDTPGLLFSISNSYKKNRKIFNGDTACEFTAEIKVSESITGVSSFKFGINAMRYNLITLNDGMDEYYANANRIICNEVTFKLAAPSSDATLSALSVGHGTASDALTVADSMSYNGDSANTVLKVQPTANDGGATIKVGTSPNPTTVVASGATADVTLSGGSCTIYIDVTAEDGTKKTYTIDYTSSYARIENLTVSTNSVIKPTKNGLSGTYNKDAFNYNVFIPGDANAVTFTPTVPTVFDVNSSISVATSGCTSSSTTVNSGSSVTITGASTGSVLTLTATAYDGTEKAYTFNFQVVSVDTGITSLTMTDGNGTEHNSGTPGASYAYEFVLPYSSVTKNYKGNFNIVLSNANATVKVDGKDYSSSATYDKGDHTLVVTAEAGNTASYKVLVSQVPADFVSLKYSITDLADYADVRTATEYNSSTNTFTAKYNVADIASPAKFYVGGTTNPGATVTVSGGLTKNTYTSNEAENYYKDLAIGTNTFSITARSSTAGSATYNFVIEYVEEKNAVTDIAITGVEDFTFNPATLSYNLEVPYTTNSVRFSVTADGNHSYVYNEKNTKLGGSNPFEETRSLSVGTNTFKYYAKADEGKGAKGTEYTFTVTRKAADADATLKSLTVKIGGVEATLTPSFNPLQLTYQVKAESGTISVSISAQANSPYATVSIPNDTDYTIGYSASQSIAITVTAENKTTKKYTVTITTDPRPLDTSFDLTSLKITGSNGTEYFSGSSASTAYGNQAAITVPYVVNSVNVTAVPYLSSEIVYVNALTGNTRSVNLNVGSNTIEVYAQAEDGTNSDGAKKYVFTIIREEAAAFSSLKFSTVSPSNYTDVMVDLVGTTLTKKINISEFGGSSQWRVYIGGSVVPSHATVTPDGKLTEVIGAGSSEKYNYYADLVMGENTFTVKVETSPSDSKTYTFVINLVEEKNSITNIAITNEGNNVDDGFAFSASQVVYEVEVPWSVTSVKLTVTADGNYAFVYTLLNGKLEHDPATLVHTVTRDLDVGKNTVRIHAEADEGRGARGTEYTINITRKAAETDATLKNLTVTINGKSVELDPAFSPDKFNYNIQDESDSLLVFIEAEANGTFATVTGAGETNLGEISVDTVKVITVSVKAEDGTIKEYKLNISKKPVPLDSNYEISSITVVGNDGVTYFDKPVSSLTYGDENVITVPYTVERVTLSAALASSKATLFGDGIYELTVIGGNGNKITVYAQAEDGANSDKSDVYLFTVIREKAAEHAWLTDLQVNDSSVKDFNRQAYDYTVREASTTEYVKVRAVAEEERARVTISVNGLDISSNFGIAYSDAVRLGEKGKSITVIITVALDGKTEYYTVRIIRSSDKPVLSSLQVGDYKIYDKDGNEIDGMDENVVGSMEDFYVEIESSNINNLVIKATTNDITAELLLPGNNGVLNVNDLLKNDGTLESAKIDIVSADATTSSDVAEYKVHFILLTSNTNADINIKEIDAFNEQYSNANLSIVYGIYPVTFTTPKLTIDVKPETKEGLASGTYKIYYNGTLTDDNGEEVANSKLNYGTNYITVTVTSSDKRATKTIVVLVERAQPCLTEASIDEIEDFEKDYSGDKNDYFYSVSSDISKLTIRVKVADGYDYAIVNNDNDLKAGVNQIKIYLFEKAVEGKSAAVYAVSDAIEDNALKVIYLNIYREQAAASNIWQILFFVFVGLCVLLLIILILVLIFRPRKTEAQPQQAPIIINTPPVQTQQQPQRREPQIIVATPPQYVQPPQYIQPPQYVQVPPPQYTQQQQKPQSPVVQPIIINTGNGEQQHKAPISIDDSQKKLPGNVTIINNGSDFTDVDGFYDNADPNNR